MTRNAIAKKTLRLTTDILHELTRRGMHKTNGWAGAVMELMFLEKKFLEEAMEAMEAGKTVEFDYEQMKKEWLGIILGGENV